MDVEFFAAVVDGHVSTTATVFGVGKELIHEVVESEAALHVNARLAVLAVDYISGRKGTRGADGYAFFAS